MLNKRGLLEAYLSITCTFFHKKGSLRNGHKKVVFAAEHTCTGHICECHPLDVYHNLYPY